MLTATDLKIKKLFYFFIFAVFGVRRSVAVNMCIICSFFTLIVIIGLCHHILGVCTLLLVIFGTITFGTTKPLNSSKVTEPRFPQPIQYVSLIPQYSQSLQAFAH